MYYAYKHWGKNTLYSALHITLDNIRARTTVTRGKVACLGNEGLLVKASPEDLCCAFSKTLYFMLGRFLA